MPVSPEGPPDVGCHIWIEPLPQSKYYFLNKTFFLYPPDRPTASTHLNSQTGRCTMYGAAFEAGAAWTVSVTSSEQYSLKGIVSVMKSTT